MPRQSGELIKLDIGGGIVSDETATGAAGRWKNGNRVRWKSGLVQTIGGWESKTLTGDVPLRGVPRSVHDWSTLDGTKYIAVGTEKRLYLIATTLVVTNITPTRDTGTLTNPFSTDTSGAYDPVGSNASYFNVNDSTHGVSVGDIVEFDSFTAVGGITVNGSFECVSVTDVDNYILKGANDASSTVAGGGGLGNYTYEITVGSGASGTAVGYGTGTYGNETYGSARTSSNTVLELRTWSLDSWGEDLVASPRGGKIYVWDASVGLGTRAAVVTNGPTTNLRVIVASDARQLISFGAHTGSADDPLNIRWCNNEDYTDWTPLITNNAGDKRVSQGSEIVAAIHTRSGTLVFTDVSVHVLQPTGGNEIYTLRGVGTNVSIASPAAGVDASGVVYFMGVTNFYVYDGTLRVLPCPSWTKFYDAEKNSSALNIDQAFSVFCSHLKNFNEVWWFYPGQGEVVNDRYAVYNYVENVWYHGRLDRSSFHDFSPFFDSPYGFDNDGVFFRHEYGVNADGAAMDAFVESSDLQLLDGDIITHLHKLIPDFDRLTGSVEITLKGRKYPRGVQFTKGPFELTDLMSQLGKRFRARQIAIRINQNVVNGSFRMGDWRARVSQDGER